MVRLAYFASCQKPDRKGGRVGKIALPYGRASDTNIQLRHRFLYLSYVLDKTPDEVTKRQLLASEINPQEVLSR